MLTDQVIDPSQQKHHVLLRPFIAAWHWLVPPSQAHMDRQSRTAVLVRTWIVITVFGGFIILVTFWGGDFKVWYKDIQAERLVKEARELANEQNLVQAVWKAQEAYSKNPENTNAIRLNGEFLTLAKRQEAVYFLELLEKQGKATPADVQTKVRALMNLNRTKEASDTLDKLMRTAAPDDRTFKLAEEVWGEREQSGIVLTVLKEYCASHPDDQQSQLRLAKFQTSTENSEEVATGLATLWKLAENPGDLGLQALEAINGIKSLDAEDMKKLADELEKHPRAAAWHQVAALRLRVMLMPVNRLRLIQDAVAKYQNAKREDRLPLVRWLVEEREFMQVVALVDEQDAKAYRPLLENYLTALTFLGKFDDLLRLVNDPDIASILNKTVRAFYQAHLSFVTGKQPDQVRLQLMAARVAAEDEGRGDMLLVIADYAEKRGILDVAEDAYGAASRSRKTERKGFEGLVRLCQLNGNLPGLMAAAHEAVRRWPDDENFMERHLYANLLAGHDVELSLERALTLLDRRQDDSAIKLAAALGYHWFGDDVMSVNHMQKVNLNKCTIGQQVVYAYLAKVSGYDDAVNIILKSIPPGARMLPQEATFLARLRQ